MLDAATKSDSDEDLEDLVPKKPQTRLLARHLHLFKQQGPINYHGKAQKKADEY